MQSSSEFTVQVVKLQFCQNQECDFSEDLHLLIEWEAVILNPEKTAAISYTWGEFNRRDVVIGHGVDGKAVKMNLGEEWDTQEVIVAFATICMEQTDRDTCWIDQLCIRQEDAEAVRRTTSQIPSIYRSLDVIAVMPGRPCKCLQDAVDHAQSIDNLASWSTRQGGKEQLMAWRNRYHEIMLLCANASGMSSYFHRIWTRQEMMYSRKISVFWTGDEAECVRTVDQADKLSSFAYRTLRTYEATGIPRETALSMVKGEVARYFCDCNIALAEYAGLVHVGGMDGLQLYTVVIRFLSGSSIENGIPLDESESVTRKYHKFLEQVGRLGGSNRLATKHHDYVASVWVDCPGYVLPLEYRNMGLPILLEDAVRQFESLSGLAISVNLPSSLLGETDRRSVLWRPTRYLDQQISGTAQLYGILTVPFIPVPLNDKNGISIYKFGNKNIAMGSRAADLDMVLHSMSTADVFEHMRHVVNQWPLSVLERVAVKSLRPTGSIAPGTEQTFDSLQAGFNGLLLDDAMVKMNRPGTKRSWRHPVALPNIDHHSAVYALVTMALNLEPDLCRRKGLRVIISLQHPACIGLTNRPADTFYELQDSDRIYREDPGTTVTVCVNKGTMTTGDTLFDVGEIAREDGIPQYRIHTVWVPQHSTAFHDINAVVDAKGKDGLIVG